MGRCSCRLRFGCRCSVLSANRSCLPFRWRRLRGRHDESWSQLGTTRGLGTSCRLCLDGRGVNLFWRKLPDHDLPGSARFRSSHCGWTDYFPHSRQPSRNARSGDSICDPNLCLHDCYCSDDHCWLCPSIHGESSHGG